MYLYCSFFLFCFYYFLQVFGGRWRSLGNALAATVPSQLGHLALALFVFLVPDLFYLELVLAVTGVLAIPYW